ncbi:MAG: hypothetical protein EOO07_30805, partial [Chitinophagaceae bacterium]
MVECTKYFSPMAYEVLTWALINQGLGKDIETYLLLNKILNDNITAYGENHESVCKSYLDLGEAHRHFDEPDRAIENYKKA